MQPSLAELVAHGDVNPATLLPMIDILPQFQPEAQLPLSGFVLNQDVGRNNALPITHYFKMLSSSKRRTASNADSTSAKENLGVRECKEGRMYDVRASSFSPSGKSRKRTIDVAEEDNSDGFITTPVFSRYFRQTQMVDPPLVSQGGPVASPDAFYSSTADDSSVKADFGPCVQISSPLKRYSHLSDFDDVPSPECQNKLSIPPESPTSHNGYHESSCWSFHGNDCPMTRLSAEPTQDQAAVSDLHSAEGQVIGYTGSETLLASTKSMILPLDRSLERGPLDFGKPISADPFLGSNRTEQKLKCTADNQPSFRERSQRIELLKEPSYQRIIPISYTRNPSASGETNHSFRLDSASAVYKPLRLR